MKNTLDILDILFKSIPFIVAIYYFLVFMTNSETEERQMYIYGYNRKSMNIFLTVYILVLFVLPIFYKLNITSEDDLISLLNCNIFMLLVCYIYSYSSKKYIIVPCITSIFIASSINENIVSIKDVFINIRENISCISYVCDIEIIIIGLLLNLLIVAIIISEIIIFVKICNIINTIINTISNRECSNLRYSYFIVMILFMWIENFNIYTHIKSINIIVTLCTLVYIVYLLKNNKCKQNKTSLYSNNQILFFVITPLVYLNFCLNIYFVAIKFNKHLEKSIRYTYIFICIFISILLYLYLYQEFNKLNKKSLHISFDKTNSTNEKIGFIISETNDDIVFEIDGMLHRYRKSDIYCIKEYRNPYASILKELNDFSQKIQTDLGKIKDKEIISNCESIKDNISNLNKMNDNHYDSIINTMNEDIFKVNNSLSKIKKNKTTEHHKHIKTCLSSINNIIDKIAKKKQELEQEKKDKNQETPS